MTRKLVSLFLVLVLAFSFAAISSAEEPVTITMMTIEHPNQPMSEDAPVLDYILEATGIKVELQIVPSSDYFTKANTKISANDMPDMIRFITTSDYKDLVHLGNFACVSDYLDEMPNLQAWLDKYPEAATLCIDGKYYGTPFMYISRDTYMGAQPVIRGDILDELNLEMPTSWDELFDVFTAMKEAYPNSYPYGNRGNGTANVGRLAYDFGAGNSIYFEPTTGEYVYGYTQEGYVDALEFWAKCYANGLVDPDYASGNNNTWNDKSSNGIYFFGYDNPTFAYNWDKAVKEDNPDAYWTPVPILTAPNGAERRMGAGLQDYGYTVVVSAASEHIEECMKLIDWMYSEEGYTTTNYGKKDVTYVVRDDGSLWFTDAVIEDSKNYADPWRGIMGAYGFGQLGVTLVDNPSTGFAFMSETVQKWQEYWTACLPTYTTPVVDPNFTPEEAGRIAELKTNLDTYVASIIDNYITGKTPIEEFVNEYAKFEELGCSELVEIYNTASNR